jgi:hypothetical protein
MYSSSESMDSLRVEVDEDESMREADELSDEDPYAIKEYILDVQGFKRLSNVFVPKEVAILSLADDKLENHHLFYPPCEWKLLLNGEQKVNRWNLHYHGISWETGRVDYGKRTDVIRSSLADATIIYVKGREKKKWVKQIVPRKLVIDMADLKCPSLKIIPSVKVKCINHTEGKNGMCALKNAYKLKQWLIEHR